MRCRASVTVYSALVFMCIATLVFALLESARTSGTRYILQMAADSAIDSVASEYSKSLWEKYRLLFTEAGGSDEILQKFDGYLSHYMQQSGIYTLSSPSSQMSDMQSAVDSGGIWLEQDIASYMTFGLFEKSDDEITLSLDELTKEIEEAGTTNDILEAFGSKSSQAKELEKAIQNIKKNLESQQTYRDRLSRALASKNVSSVRSNARYLVSKMNTLKSLVRTFNTKADNMNTYLRETENKYASEIAQMSEENRQIIEEKKQAYKEYSDPNGQRRKEINALQTTTASNIPDIEGIADLMDEIKILKAEQRADKDIDNSDAIADCFSDARDLLEGVTIPTVESFYNTGDTVKENQLNKASSLLKKGVLSLVLPENRTASLASIDTSHFPSKTSMSTRTTNTSIVNKVLINQYIGHFFSSFIDDSKESVAYEYEYILCGKNTDKANLEGALLQLLAVREGLNFIHIMGDSTKRNEAKVLAMTIAGVASVTGLQAIFECLIIATWALAESVMDLRALLNGEKVPLYKTADEWNLSLENMLSIGDTGKVTGSGKGSERGYGYETYLSLLLYMQNDRDKAYRIMDMVQMNMRKEESGFLMKNCIYGMKIQTTCDSSHFFLNYVSDSGIDKNYKVTVETVKAY